MTEEETRDNIIQKLGDTALKCNAILTDAQTGAIIASPVKLSEVVEKYLREESSQDGGNVAHSGMEAMKILVQVFGKPKTVDNGDGTFTHTFR